MGAQGVLAPSSLNRHDDDYEDDGPDHDYEEDDYHEGYFEEADHWQEGGKGERQEDGCSHEEEGGWHLRPEEAQRRVGGYLRCQDAPPHRGHKEDLGVHQE